MTSKDLKMLAIALHDYGPLKCPDNRCKYKKDYLNDAKRVVKFLEESE